MTNISNDVLGNPINVDDYDKSASPLIAELRLKIIKMLACNGEVSMDEKWSLVCDDRKKGNPLENHAMYFINETDELIMRIMATNEGPDFEENSEDDEAPKSEYMYFSTAFQKFDTYGTKSTPQEMAALSAKEWKTFKDFAYSFSDVQSFKVPFKAIIKDTAGISDKELKSLLHDALDSIENFRRLQEYISRHTPLEPKDERLVKAYLNPSLAIIPDYYQKRDFHTAQELKIILKALKVEHNFAQFVLTCNSSVMPYLRVENFEQRVTMRKEWEEYCLALDYLFEQGSKCRDGSELEFNDGDNRFYMFEHIGMPAIHLTSQSCGYIFTKKGEVIQGYVTGSDMLYSKDDILNGGGPIDWDKISLIINGDKILFWDSILDPEQYTIFGAVAELYSFNQGLENDNYQIYRGILAQYKKDRDMIKEKKLLEASIGNTPSRDSSVEAFKI